MGYDNENRLFGFGGFGGLCVFTIVPELNQQLVYSHHYEVMTRHSSKTARGNDARQDSINQ